MNRVGVMVPCRLPPARLVGLARQAEEAGLDEVWVVEDCFFTGRRGAVAASVLAATERITVGIGVLPTVARNPAIAAMELATLAELHPRQADRRVRPRCAVVDAADRRVPALAAGRAAGNAHHRAGATRRGADFRAGQACPARQRAAGVPAGGGAAGAQRRARAAIAGGVRCRGGRHDPGRAVQPRSTCARRWRASPRARPSQERRSGIRSWPTTSSPWTTIPRGHGRGCARRSSAALASRPRRTSGRSPSPGTCCR